MASNSSGPLSPGESYTIGQYTFSISSQYDSGEDTTYITVDCNYGEDAGVKETTVEGNAEIESWHVECNENTADIYAAIKITKQGHEGTADFEDLQEYMPIVSSDAVTYMKKTKIGNKTVWETKVIEASPYEKVAAWYQGSGNKLSYVKASSTASEEYANRYTHNGKTVYFHPFGNSFACYNVEPVNYMPNNSNAAEIAWTIIYGETVPVYEYEEIFAARFQIVPEDADPEDWDDPIDDGDPSYTLITTVRGALSGRHNDPIYDTSYSYVPVPNTAVKGYGCGGDGGHGGGGGAGASTVIVYKYSTSKAGSHETYAYARRHGYGSGGGKGGKGGDGCIIVYW